MSETVFRTSTDARYLGADTVGARQMYVYRGNISDPENRLPSQWIEGEYENPFSFRSFFVLDDGSVQLGVRYLNTDQSAVSPYPEKGFLKPAGLPSIRVRITMNDVVYEWNSNHRATKEAYPASYTAAGLRGAYNVIELITVPGSTDFYDAIAALTIRGNVQVEVDIPDYDPPQFGHWRAEFITGGGAYIDCRTDTAPTRSGNTITQTFAVAGVKPNAPAAWARTEGMAPTIDSITINTSTWNASMALSGGEIIQAALNNMNIDVIVVSNAGEDDESRVSVEINGIRSVLPTSPYNWIINEGRSDLDDALTGFNIITDRIELVIRPGYIWRWWSGEGTRTFDGHEYEGALLGAGNSLIEITGVEATVERPDTQAQVKFSMTASDIRRRMQQHLGTIAADVRWMKSLDGGETYIDMNKRLVGKVSGIEYDSPIITATIISWLADDYMKPLKWSHESYSQRYPGSKAFEYASEFARENPTFDWPRMPP